LRIKRINVAWLLQLTRKDGGCFLFVMVGRCFAECFEFRAKFKFKILKMARLRKVPYLVAQLIFTNHTWYKVTLQVQWKVVS